MTRISRYAVLPNQSDGLRCIVTAQSMISRAELEADQRRQDLTFAELVHQVERRMLHLVIINTVTMVGVLVGILLGVVAILGSR